MSGLLGKISKLLVLAAATFTTLSSAAFAEQTVSIPKETRHVDVVIALDVSGSMSGLIESAKQRLWDIVNELGRAQPQPELRLAILTYGNPAYGAESGYVKVDLPFTHDLDAVNRTLFSFGTSGGDEYVARVVNTSINSLNWSSEPDALQIVFVAGNEAADQDPQISVLRATRAANEKGIVVNAIYCGQENDADAAGWRHVAHSTNGMYASINQNTAAVANIATPMDEELARLNQELNSTYIAYGKDGDRYRDNQVEQDKNANTMSQSAAASRAVTKAGALYDSSSWDLLDAVESGADLAEFEAEELPEEMQTMSTEEREQFVGQTAEKRDAIQSQIKEIDSKRRAYIADERSKLEGDDADGLDAVMQKGLRAVAEKKGFTFEGQ